MINVVNKLNIYEVDGKETNNIKDEKILEVKSHWNIQRFVILKFNDVEITVSARDLETAIKNATNTNK